MSKRIQQLTIDTSRTVSIEEGDYKIFDDGRLYSTYSRKLLAGVVNENGYRLYSLRKDGVTTITRCHRLVAKYFLKEPEDYMYKWAKGTQRGKVYVNHKDGDKLNNKVSNLEWCTASENVIHAQKTGLQPLPPKKMAKSPLNHNKGYTLLPRETKELIRSKHFSCGDSLKSIAKELCVPLGHVRSLIEHERPFKFSGLSYLKDLTREEISVVVSLRNTHNVPPRVLAAAFGKSERYINTMVINEMKR